MLPPIFDTNPYIEESLHAPVGGAVGGERVELVVVIVRLDHIIPEEPEEGFTYDFIFEPSPVAVLDGILPRYVNVQMWRVLLESNAAEHGARMTAMENATENAEDLIDDLTLHYNKARQASITKELLEVVSGAEGLH